VGPDLDVEHGHERAQFRSQATAADATMRRTIQATSTTAVRRFRLGRLRVTVDLASGLEADIAGAGSSTG
jgi:hypothetical protein